ncbi:MAG: amino acid ABC transporter substrate-binding protein [Rhodomicrobium sp.]|nr:amino acid ABC transporter substrate-binding protein [Rhodomicrobium sp.]
MSYTDAEQQPIGFSMDLCGLVANKIKQTSGLADLKINYQPLAPGDGASPVQNGTADIVCGATAVTPELQQQAGFSVPIFASELRWIVPRKLRVERELRHRRRRTEMITPSSAGDLKGKTVALTGGSPATTSLVLTLSVDRSLGLSILEGKDDAESFKLVESGRASAFLADDVLLVGLKANAKNPDAFGFLDDAYPGRSYALMFRKDDKPFKELVDGVLTEAMASGEYAALYSKWFESPIPPRNVNLDYPMPAALKALIKAPGEKPGSSEGEKGQANLSLNR